MKDRLSGGAWRGSKIASRESKNEQDTVSLPEQTQRTIEHRLIFVCFGKQNWKNSGNQSSHDIEQGSTRTGDRRDGSAGLRHGNCRWH
jgi:hypothetical protein